MSVEIKELVIRAVVNQAGGQAVGGQKGAGEGTGCGDGAEGDDTKAAEDRQTVVEAAVREVLRILRASKER